MPRRTDVKSFASGGAVFVWLERLCDTCIILALCAYAHSRDLSDCPGLHSVAAGL
jgi:hypothetical protein